MIWRLHEGLGTAELLIKVGQGQAA
jgi:hypothetical protein